LDGAIKGDLTFAACVDLFKGNKGEYMGEFISYVHL